MEGDSRQEQEIDECVGCGGDDGAVNAVLAIGCKLGGEESPEGDKTNGEEGGLGIVLHIFAVGRGGRVRRGGRGLRAAEH